MKTINLICQDCGTKLLKQSQNKDKRQRPFSTWYYGFCDVCGKEKTVTENRDFGYLKL